MEEKKKELTELQTKFLTALFGEALGNFAEAKRLAGYSDYTSVAEVISPIKDEIIKHTTDFLAANAPKAAFKIVNSLDEAAPNANRLKAAESILNRVGLVEKKSGDVSLDVSNLPKGGIFILPAKEVQVFEKIKTESESEGEED